MVHVGKNTSPMDPILWDQKFKTRLAKDSEVRLKIINSRGSLWQETFCKNILRGFIERRAAMNHLLLHLKANIKPHQNQNGCFVLFMVFIK